MSQARRVVLLRWIQRRAISTSRTPSCSAALDASNNQSKNLDVSSLAVYVGLQPCGHGMPPPILFSLHQRAKPTNHYYAYHDIRVDSQLLLKFMYKRKALWTGSVARRLATTPKIGREAPRDDDFSNIAKTHVSTFFSICPNLSKFDGFCPKSFEDS